MQACLSLFLVCLIFSASVIRAEDEAPVAQEPAPSDFVVPNLEGAEVEDQQFKAEINQLMGLIVNSLYSNRDIFVRELVSNAADALDKIRFLSLTDPEQLATGAKLEIKIRVDEENNIIHIRDTGIGMTKQDLINNLGSIAKSGTKDFIKKIEAGKEDLTQIGQFGVGFYSAFLIADKVTVTTKNNADDQYVWVSTMDESTAYQVAKDPRGNTLGRGTTISLHLKEDASAYLSNQKLKELVQHYNQFITVPVYIWESHEETVQPPAKEETETDTETEEKEKVEGEEGIDIEVEEELVEEEEPQEPTKITVWNWEQINSDQPLWTRSKSEITDDEYKQFYKETLEQSGEDPLEWTHFKAEGDVEFNALLYIPARPPPGSTDFSSASSLVKLYVKRVFISDSFEDFLPVYLNFIKGIVDSDDLPLNVSREMLQHNNLLKMIQKKLIRKIIGLLQKLMENEDKWETFYSSYHQFLKMGIIKDASNKNRISKLLKFTSAKNPDKQITFEQYIENFKEGQDEIFYLGGENKESLLNSPLIERLLKRGYDVMLFTEPIDEYMAMNLNKFDSKYALVDVAKDGLKLDQEDKARQEEFKDDFLPLTDYLKEVLSKHVSAVQISMRLSTSPCALVSSTYSMSANVERIMKAQALADKSSMYGMGGKKVLEINPRHPIMKHLLGVVENDEQTTETEDIIRMMYDTAALASGYTPEDPISLSERLNRLISTSLNIDPNEVVDEEEFDEEDASEDSEDSEDSAEEVAQTEEATEETVDTNEEL